MMETPPRPLELFRPNDWPDSPPLHVAQWTLARLGNLHWLPGAAAVADCWETLDRSNLLPLWPREMFELLVCFHAAKGTLAAVFDGECECFAFGMWYYCDYATADWSAIDRWEGDHPDPDSLFLAFMGSRGLHWTGRLLAEFGRECPDFAKYRIFGCVGDKKVDIPVEKVERMVAYGNKQKIWRSASASASGPASGASAPRPSSEGSAQAGVLLDGGGHPSVPDADSGGLSANPGEGVGRKRPGERPPGERVDVSHE